MTYNELDDAGKAKAALSFMMVPDESKRDIDLFNEDGTFDDEKWKKFYYDSIGMVNIGRRFGFTVETLEKMIMGGMQDNINGIIAKIENVPSESQEKGVIEKEARKKDHKRGWTTEQRREKRRNK